MFAAVETTSKPAESVNTAYSFRRRESKPLAVSFLEGKVNQDGRSVRVSLEVAEEEEGVVTVLLAALPPNVGFGPLPGDAKERVCGPKSKRERGKEALSKGLIWRWEENRQTEEKRRPTEPCILLQVPLTEPFNSMELGPCVKELDRHTDWVRCLAIVEGKVWSVSRDKMLNIWTPDGVFVQEIRLPAVASPHVMLYVGSGLVWFALADVPVIGVASANGEWRGEIEGHAAPVRDLVMSQGRIWSASEDKTVGVWSGPNGGLEYRLQGHTGYVLSAVAVHHDDGDFVWTGSSDHKIRVWNASSGECVGQMSEHIGPVSSLIFTDQKVFSGSFDGRLFIWEPKTMQVMKRLKGHGKEKVKCLAVTEGSQIWSGGTDCKVRVWSVRNPQFLSKKVGHSAAVNALLATDEFVWSASSDKTIRLWKIRENASFNLYEQMEELRGLTVHAIQTLRDNLTIEREARVSLESKVASLSESYDSAAHAVQDISNKLEKVSETVSVHDQLADQIMGVEDMLNEQISTANANIRSIFDSLHRETASRENQGRDLATRIAGMEQSFSAGLEAEIQQNQSREEKQSLLAHQVEDVDRRISLMSQQNERREVQQTESVTLLREGLVSLRSSFENMEIEVTVTKEEVGEHKKRQDKQGSVIQLQSEALHSLNGELEEMKLRGEKNHSVALKATESNEKQIAQLKVDIQTQSSLLDACREATQDSREEAAKSVCEVTETIVSLSQKLERSGKEWQNFKEEVAKRHEFESISSELKDVKKEVERVESDQLKTMQVVGSRLESAEFNIASLNRVQQTDKAAIAVSLDELSTALANENDALRKQFLDMCATLEAKRIDSEQAERRRQETKSQSIQERIDRVEEAGSKSKQVLEAAISKNSTGLSDVERNVQSLSSNLSKLEETLISQNEKSNRSIQDAIQTASKELSAYRLETKEQRDADMKAAKSSMEIVSTRLQNEIDRGDSMNRDSLSQLSEQLRSEQGTLRDLLAANESQVSDMQSRNTAFGAHLEALDRQNKALANSMTDKFGSGKSQLRDNFLTMYNELKEELNSVRESMVSAGQEVSGKFVKMSSRMESMGILQAADVLALRAEDELMNQQVTALKGRCDSSEASLRQHESEIMPMKKAVGDIAGDVNGFHSLLRSTQASVSEQVTAVQQEFRQVREVSLREADQMREVLTALSGRADESKKRAEQQADELADSGAKLQSLQELVRLESKKHDSNQSRVVNHLKKVDESINNLRLTTATMVDEIAAESSSRQKLDTSVTGTLARHDSTVSMLRLQTESVQADVATHESLLQQIATYNNSNDVRVRKVEVDLAAEVKARSADVAALNSSLADSVESFREKHASLELESGMSVDRAFSNLSKKLTEQEHRLGEKLDGMSKELEETNDLQILMRETHNKVLTQQDESLQLQGNSLVKLKTTSEELSETLFSLLRSLEAELGEGWRAKSRPSERRAAQTATSHGGKQHEKAKKALLPAVAFLPQSPTGLATFRNGSNGSLDELGSVGSRGETPNSAR